MNADHKSPAEKLAQARIERQRLVDLATASLPPPALGMVRLMWFDNTDTPMPVDVPEVVAEKIKTIWADAEANKGPFRQIPLAEYFKAEKQCKNLLRPYIEKQYPDLARKKSRGAWWKRVLGNFCR